VLGAALAGPVLLAAAACGGGGPTAASYRKALDAQCASAQAFNRQLPVLQRTQHLSVHQLQLRAAQRTAKFISAVSHLTPPGSLAGAQQHLVDTLNNPPSGDNTAKLIPFANALLADYTALGATGCESFERQAIESASKLSQG
jgi:hypothetical protein